MQVSSAIVNEAYIDDCENMLMIYRCDTIFTSFETLGLLLGDLGLRWLSADLLESLERL